MRDETIRALSAPVRRLWHRRGVGRRGQRPGVLRKKEALVLETLRRAGEALHVPLVGRVALLPANDVEDQPGGDRVRPLRPAERRSAGPPRRGDRRRRRRAARSAQPVYVGDRGRVARQANAGDVVAVVVGPRYQRGYSGPERNGRRPRGGRLAPDHGPRSGRSPVRSSPLYVTPGTAGSGPRPAAAMAPSVPFGWRGTGWPVGSGRGDPGVERDEQGAQRGIGRAARSAAAGRCPFRSW